MYLSTKYSCPALPISRRRDRCDRMIQNEYSDQNGGSVFVFSGDVYVTMQITFRTRKRSPVVICIVTYTSPPKTNTHYRRLGR